MADVPARSPSRLADESAWVSALHPDDRDRIVAEAEACIAAELPFGQGFHIARPLDAAALTAWLGDRPGQR